MINPENADHSKADALDRRKPSLECSGRGRPPCHQIKIRHFCNYLYRYNIINIFTLSSRTMQNV
ncbi:MAG: hypothetical protein FJY65_03665 [Calditrichaeota bacterium]|nr:hypothetical protein [Calditrichota bacterium]